MLSSFTLLLLLTLSFPIQSSIISAAKHQHPPCHENERSALLQFKHSFSVNKSSTIDALLLDFIDDPSFPCPPIMWPWNNNKNNTLGVGDEGDDCCRWDGVECDHDTGHVIALDLSAGCLYGSMDSSSTLFQLVHLQKLDLSYNNFNYSHVPSQMGHLSRLTHLDLSFSSFAGPIPTQILKLSSLVTLSFSGNPQLWLPRNPGLVGLVRNLTSIQNLRLGTVNISSTVPDSFANFSSLERLQLYGCRLHGQFPANIFNLPNIRVLDISENKNLSGFLPEFKASNRLQILMLSITSFWGEIPNSIGNLHSLEYLTFANCNFLGSIPESLSNLTRLKTLSNSGNNFRRGRFPPWIGRLSQLYFLYLSSTNLTGEIPPTLANLTRLIILGFPSNELTGRIPSGLRNLTRLEFLDASDNALLGTVPISIFELANLKLFDIDHNRLSGTVELDKLVNLKNLKVLRLSNNRLSALNSTVILNATFPNFTSLELASCNLSGFPHFLRTQNYLKVLDLEGNSIGGLIPKWIWNLTSRTLISINLANNCLTGFEESPIFLRTQNELQILDLEGNNIGGLIPKWSWNLTSRTLISINLANNCLTGFEESPIFLPWEGLQVLILNSNKLQGSLPIPPPSIILYQASNNSFAGNLSPMLVKFENLQVFDVSHNNLHGTIPDSFKRGSKLRTINLSRNNLGGPLPRSLANCKMLEIFDIGNNEINDTFPSWLGVLPKLHILVLSFNQFHGVIPNFNSRARDDMPFLDWNGMKISNTGNLTYMASSVIVTVSMLDLGVSLARIYDTRDSMTVNIKGVETQYTNIPCVFKMIDVSNNRFEGWIPNSIGDLRGLHLVNISNNSFIGFIPPSFGKLSSLESLDLSHNNLQGPIPEQLRQLTFLEVFNVSYNNISGSIPQGNQFDTYENNSYIGITRLCGHPLSRKCGTSSNPPGVEVREENSVNSIEIDWLVMGIGYASGLIVGLVIETTFIKWRHDWASKKLY